MDKIELRFAVFKELIWQPGSMFSSDPQRAVAESLEVARKIEEASKDV